MDGSILGKYVGWSESSPVSGYICCGSYEVMELGGSCKIRSYRSWLNIMCNEL
jgi:hypothetical protein